MNMNCDFHRVRKAATECWNEVREDSCFKNLALLVFMGHNSSCPSSEESEM